MTAPVETEFRLRATRPLEIAAVDATVRELGLACRSAGSTEHIDTYLDDDASSLARAGLGLRLRSAPDGSHVTCKTRGDARDGLFVREEHEAAWTGAEGPTRAADLPAPLRDLVEPFTLDRALRPVLQLTVQRDVRRLQHDDRDLCALAIDRVEAGASGRSTTFSEVEIEVLEDVASNERLAQALLQRLPLHPAEDDKPTHAAARLGMPVGPPAAPKPTAATALSEALGRCIRRHLEAMRHAEVGVRGERDPEHVHAMRVAVRRLRSIVRAFRDLWPQPTASALTESLGDLGRRLGAVRDLDVMLAGIASDLAELPGALPAAAERARAWIAQRRDDARTQLQEWLRSDARLGVAATIERDLDAFDRAATTTTVGAALPARLQRAVESVRRLAGSIAPELPLAPVHELRIAAKRLRYLAEEFAGALPHDFDKSLATIAALQQALGVVCDHEVAAERLLSWIHPVATTSPDGAMTAAAVGALAARQAWLAKKARKPALRAVQRADRGKVWRRFPAPTPADANLSSGRQPDRGRTA